MLGVIAKWPALGPDNYSYHNANFGKAGIGGEGPIDLIEESSHTLMMLRISALFEPCHSYNNMAKFLVQATTSAKRRDNDLIFWFEGHYVLLNLAQIKKKSWSCFKGTFELGFDCAKRMWFCRFIGLHTISVKLFNVY